LGKLVRVPYHLLCLLHRLIGSDGVSLAVDGIGRNDIDVARSDAQAMELSTQFPGQVVMLIPCVVPPEGDLISNFDKGHTICGSWGDHGNTAWRQPRINGCFGGVLVA